MYTPHLAEEVPFFDDERTAEEIDNMPEEEREEYLASLED